MGHNKFLLPKIGKRKDSNINTNNLNNMNSNMQAISQNSPQSSKMIFKDKMLLKSKKLNTSTKNRTP